MQVTAIAMASVEKAKSALYQLRFYPKERIHQPWIDHDDGQTIGGLRHLDKIAAQISGLGWLADTPNMSQADITAAVVWGRISVIRPNLNVKEVVPHLWRLAMRCDDLPAFRAAEALSAPRNSQATQAGALPALRGRRALGHGGSRRGGRRRKRDQVRPLAGRARF
jgi:glutathione S-transferase